MGKKIFDYTHIIVLFSTDYAHISTLEAETYVSTRVVYMGEPMQKNTKQNIIFTIY